MSGLLKRLFSRKQNKEKRSGAVIDPREPQVLTRDAHCVSRKNISKNALKVLYRLNEAGYQAYLVGGGVRDLLLGLRPKDFDVATDATPEEIYKLFRNCRLIGRRFRLAHILYGREVIEVATFRAGHEPETKNTNKKSSKNEHSRTSDHGMLMRDNVYGSMVEDAFRRDFTVNALYYTVTDFSIIDYTNGLQDLAERKLRLIGEPEERYREDPVRILRAIRLSCKLDLNIEEKTARPIKQLSSLLSHVSSARLWDESNKMLLAGHAETTWNSLCEHHVATYLFSQTVDCLEQSNHPDEVVEFKRFITAALKSTDKRIAEQQPVTPAFLFAVFLWLPLQTIAQQLIKKGASPYDAHARAAGQVMDIQRQAIGIPKRFAVVAKEIWSLQHRLANKRRKSVFSVIGHPRFRAAYDFLCLRAGSDEELSGLAKWWTDYQNNSSEDRDAMLREVSHPARKKRKKFNHKRKPANAKETGNN